MTEEKDRRKEKYEKRKKAEKKKRKRKAIRDWNEFEDRRSNRLDYSYFEDDGED
jgi:hypothetical protein